MATVCKTCRFYQQIPDDKEEGICFLQLPPWVQKAAAHQSRQVNGMDTCELWNIDKANHSA